MPENRRAATSAAIRSYWATESLNFRALFAILNDFFGDAQHVFRVGRKAVAVVDAASDEPDDLVARQQHELPLLLGHGDLGVDEEVRHLLRPVMPNGTNQSPSRQRRSVSGNCRRSASICAMFSGTPKFLIVSMSQYS